MQLLVESIHSGGRAVNSFWVCAEIEFQMHFVLCSIVDCMKNDSMSAHMQTVDLFMYGLSQKSREQQETSNC